MTRHIAALPFIGFSLACIYPGAHFIGVNAAQLQWMGTSSVLVIAALCGILWLTGIVLAVAPALLPIRWSVHQAFSVGIVGIFVLFSFGPITQWLVSEVSVSPAFSNWIYLLILAGSLFIVWRLSTHEPVRMMLAIAAALMLVLTGPALGSVSKIFFLAYDNKQRGEGDASSLVLSGNNVYYVILDGYAGRTALKKYLSYDIDPFLQQMSDLGYSHIDLARTNYMTTHVAIMSILDMDYVVTENSLRYSDRMRFFPYRIRKGQPPVVVRKLTSAGYDFVHIGNSWAPCNPRFSIKCVINEDRFGSVEYATSVFLGPTPVLKTLQKLIEWPMIHDDALLLLTENINNLLGSKRPFFAFVHHMSPHPPYLNAGCATGFTAEEGREQYKNTIECLNVSVLALAKRIQTLDPSAIVVFQADHGSAFEVNIRLPLREWSEAAIDERSSILNLVHVPELCKKWLRPDLSQINTMRLVLGCLEGRPPAYLNERTYSSAYETSLDFGLVLDVTARINARRGNSGWSDEQTHNHKIP